MHHPFVICLIHYIMRSYEIWAYGLLSEKCPRDNTKFICIRKLILYNIFYDNDHLRINIFLVRFSIIVLISQ